MEVVQIGGIEVGGPLYTFILIILLAIASWVIVSILKRSAKRAEEAEQKEWEQDHPTAENKASNNQKYNQSNS